jgi:hypothetical protein
MTNRIIYFGDYLTPNGIVRNEYFQFEEIRSALPPVPVVWQGNPAVLYYWKQRRKSMPFNPTASRLITHNGFEIRGPAVVITGWDRWHHFKKPGDEDHVREMLEPVLPGLAGRIFIGPSNRSNTHQNIYVENDNDAFAVKMALP